MFPLKDNIPARNFPYVNIGLIVVNSIFFIYGMSYGQAFDQLIFTLGFIPARFLAQQSETLFSPTGFLPVFSSMFLHANFIHLISNMWMLWIFGDNVEDCMGHGRYLLFFFTVRRCFSICPGNFKSAISYPHGRGQRCHIRGTRGLFTYVPQCQDTHVGSHRHTVLYY